MILPRRLDRRAFLKTVGATALGGLAGCARSSGGGGATTSVASTAAPSSATPLAALPAAGVGPPSSLLRGFSRELDLELRVVSGALPPDLGGHYFLVGARPRGAGVFAFNGEGCVARVDFASQRARLRSRAVMTPCGLADRALAGTSQAFFDVQDGPVRCSSALGVRSQPNTALVPLGPDRLLVTSDAGRPWELDPTTLGVASAVGGRHEWRPGFELPALARGLFSADVFPLVQTSAHPAHDAFTGETFSVNYGGTQSLQLMGQRLLGASFTDLLRWDGRGALERWRLVDPAGAEVRIEQSVHQLGVTANYVLLADTAFRIEPQKLLDPAYLEPQDPRGRLYLIRRADLAQTPAGGDVVARAVDLPRELAHFLVDYDDAGDLLRVHAIHNCATDGSEWLLTADRRQDGQGVVSRDHLGFVAAATDQGLIGRHQIDAAAGRLLASELHGDDALTWGHTLYANGYAAAPRHESLFQTWTGFDPELLPARVAQAYASYAHRTCPLAALPARRPATLVRSDLVRGGIGDAFVFPVGWVPCSPEWVPLGRGYVVCAVISDQASRASSGDELWIFAADDLAQGPVCRLGHPALELPFTLHTAWLEQIQPRAASYRIDPVADHARDVAALEPALQDVFARQVYPYL